MKNILIYLCLFWTVSSIAQISVQTITQEFDGSGGLNIGSDGFLYVANFGESLDNGTGKEVWKIDFKSGGQPVLFASGLNGASGNDFDSEGNLFQSNIAAGNVSKINPDGMVSFFATNGISCNVGINIDAEDNLYVCNCCGNNGNTIRKVTKAGVSTLFSSSPLLSCPNGLTRDKDDNLYASNFSNGNVVKINPDGQASLLASTPGISGQSGPSNGHIIYSEKEDVLYLASHGSHRIYKLTLDGQLSVLAGSGQRGNKDGSAEEASFSRPNGLALSVTEDTLFVNSSIPVTDANGRPLNPSVIRMISGLRSVSGLEEEPLNKYFIFYDSSGRSIEISGVTLADQTLNVTLLTQDGKIILQESIKLENGGAELNIPMNITNGLYFISVATNSGRAMSNTIFIN